MPDAALFPTALDAPELDALAERCLGSSLVGESTLMGTFEKSQGFGMILTAEGLGQLARGFSYLTPFVDLCFDRARQKRLLPPMMRPMAERLLPRPNAFYINVLVLAGGGSVGPHVDATLREPSGTPDAVPDWVSVLYLKVPTGLRGGALCLHGGDYGVTRIKPEPGLFLHFRGELTHEVEAV
jgi:hypothetical protein